MLLSVIHTIGVVSLSLMLVPAVLLAVKVAQQTWMRVQYVRGDNCRAVQEQ